MQEHSLQKGLIACGFFFVVFRHLWLQHDATQSAPRALTPNRYTAVLAVHNDSQIVTNSQSKSPSQIDSNSQIEPNARIEFNSQIVSQADYRIMSNSRIMSNPQIVLNTQAATNHQIVSDSQNQDNIISYSQKISNLELAHALNRVQDPVFVVYGNRGYQSLLGNFVCNMALFPEMHSHILAIVTDNETSAFLMSLSESITVFVAHQDLHEAYDFESPGYLRLMITRGLVLVDLLQAAQVLSKTLVWLEPDFYYMQNLLSRPEMTETTSDLVFYWDQAMYCGCFIRFSPNPASLKFYKEVMDRMQRIHSEGGTTNDQIILNGVVSSQQPNHTLFDRCLYRSGTFNTGGFMVEYQLACQGVQAVAQHHNWIVGADSKMKRAKETKGWFLADDGKTCRQRDMMLVVMTMNRPESLKRLIHSISSAHYLPENTVDLRVTVDRDFSGGVDEATMQFLGELHWPHGLLEVVVWPEKMGLYGQWVHSWPAEKYPEGLYTAVVLLEDDLEVSPHYAKWFMGAHRAYGHVSGVGAVTGQRPNLVAALNGPPSVAGQVPGGVKAFGYMLMATWSFSPKHSVWRDFRQWVIRKRTEDPKFTPSVPGIIPNQWYEQFTLRGEEENMWEMWFIRFADERKLYTVYPWAEDGRKAIVGNWMEAGLHFSGTPSLDFPIMTEWHSNLLTQQALPLVGYDLDFTSVLPTRSDMDIPVVYTFFVNDDGRTSSSIPLYAWRTMAVTASYGNRVVLITSSSIPLPDEILTHTVELRSMSEFYSEKLDLFRERYKPWGIKEPWERQNTERFFILEQFMKVEKLPLIFFADSDVAVLAKLSTALLNEHNDCDSLFSLQHNGPIMHWDTGEWVVFAGTSVLKRAVLDDFTQFVIELYQGDYIKWLELKRDNWPYVCDMSLWYLFAGASDGKLRMNWGWPNPNLPKTSQHRICDILELGFSHVGGYTKDVNRIIPTHRSIHFQGGRKDDALLLTSFEGQ